MTSSFPRKVGGIGLEAPNITSYRIEEVEVPAPVSEEQAIREVLGASEPAPRGPGRRMLRITLEGDRFPEIEVPFSISIGDQTLVGLTVSPDGSQASALMERVPNEGDAIAFHFPREARATEGGVLLAGHFETSKLEGGIA